jgi:hypothetical protein
MSRMHGPRFEETFHINRTKIKTFRANVVILTVIVPYDTLRVPSEKLRTFEVKSEVLANNYFKKTI